MIIAKVIFAVIRFLQEHSSSLLYPQCITATAESSMFMFSIVLFNNNLGVDLGYEEWLGVVARVLCGSYYPSYPNPSLFLSKPSTFF